MMGPPLSSLLLDHNWFHAFTHVSGDILDWLAAAMPSRVLVIPSSMSLSSTTCSPRRAASSTASFTTLAISAPENPDPSFDITSAKCSAEEVLPCPLPLGKVLAWLTGVPLRCTLAMSRLSFSSGRQMVTLLEILPGLSKAGSRTPGRLVAAISITPGAASNPSSSVSSWFKVWSLSSLSPAPRRPPTASISSMKTMAGALRRACLKRSRTRAAPRPTKSSTNSDAEHAKNGTSASPATALASIVLPVPGGPLSRTPRGTRAFRLGSSVLALERKATSSRSSTMAWSRPAMSLNLTAGTLARPPGPRLEGLRLCLPLCWFIVRRAKRKRGTRGIQRAMQVKTTRDRPPVTELRVPKRTPRCIRSGIKLVSSLIRLV
mmetsp:Transcript_7211/g.18434  ORF Transcript_7211/g.18434 Transcript_7211/m.18434 type:complete len:376 (+) Transcript_7211:362-1489(+)